MPHFFSVFSNFQMIDQKNMQILSALKPRSIIGIDFVIFPTLKSSSQEFLHYSPKETFTIKLDHPAIKMFFNNSSEASGHSFGMNLIIWMFSNLNIS